MICGPIWCLLSHSCNIQMVGQNKRHIYTQVLDLEECDQTLSPNVGPTCLPCLFICTSNLYSVTSPTPLSSKIFVLYSLPFLSFSHIILLMLFSTIKAIYFKIIFLREKSRVHGKSTHTTWFGDRNDILFAPLCFPILSLLIYSDWIMARIYFFHSSR